MTEPEPLRRKTGSDQVAGWAEGSGVPCWTCPPGGWRNRWGDTAGGGGDLPCCSSAAAPLKAIPEAPSPSCSPDQSPLSPTEGKGLRTRRQKDLWLSPCSLTHCHVALDENLPVPQCPQWGNVRSLRELMTQQSSKRRWLSLYLGVALSLVAAPTGRTHCPEQSQYLPSRFPVDVVTSRCPSLSIPTGAAFSVSLSPVPLAWVHSKPFRQGTFYLKQTQ